MSHFLAYVKPSTGEALSKQVVRMTCPMCVSLCSQLLQHLPDMLTYGKTMGLRRGICLAKQLKLLLTKAGATTASYNVQPVSSKDRWYIPKKE